jgi:hypothetical protein
MPGERRLVQLDLAIVAALDDYDVVHLYQVFLDGLAEVGGHPLRGGQVVVGDSYKITQWKSS